MKKYDIIRNHPYYKRLYVTWNHMRQRCYNPNDARYKWYGAKGVKICDIWNGEYGFLNFFYWAIATGFKENLSIDRIDVDGDYSPWNCKWSTHKEQQRNKTNSHYYEYNGQKKCIGEWAELYNIDYNLLQTRLSKGWTIEQALFLRKHQHHKKRTPVNN
jgi:hypothetical protein